MNLVFCRFWWKEFTWNQSNNLLLCMSLYSLHNYYANADSTVSGITESTCLCFTLGEGGREAEISVNVALMLVESDTFMSGAFQDLMEPRGWVNCSLLQSSLTHQLFQSTPFPCSLHSAFSTCSDWLGKRCYTAWIIERRKRRESWPLTVLACNQACSGIHLQLCTTKVSHYAVHILKRVKDR